ncbi:hypothetical protein CLV63_113205 [Murinocardiopsis flavida]|uniref:Uncharacterized protein n=1 Tax=Murinocardiopsis flavida TaxID=645275 RepID=A0A2P8DFQ0_9ACTN|nr:hypothetical protein [Murinocardiopsis flavida]PSK96042.1 hypothetical protein CLV63_113205 [Murinocardiopsis flavida]
MATPTGTPILTAIRTHIDDAVLTEIEVYETDDGLFGHHEVEAVVIDRENHRIHTITVGYGGTRGGGYIGFGCLPDSVTALNAEIDRHRRSRAVTGYRRIPTPDDGQWPAYAETHDQAAAREDARADEQATRPRRMPGDVWLARARAESHRASAAAARAHHTLEVLT